MEIMKQFSQKLKLMREEHGLNQSQLADKLGVSRGSISFYENGDRIPDIEFLFKAAEFFQVSSDWFLGLTKEKRRLPAPIDKLCLTEPALKTLEATFSQYVGESFSNEVLKAIKEIENEERNHTICFAEELIEIAKTEGRFNAGLVIDILNLLLSEENELHILKNLALYVFAGQKNNEKVGFVVTANLNDGDSTYATVNSNLLSNIFLLQAENSIRILKDMNEKYQIIDIDGLKNSNEFEK